MSADFQNSPAQLVFVTSRSHQWMSMHGMKHWCGWQDQEMYWAYRKALLLKS